MPVTRSQTRKLAEASAKAATVVEPPRVVYGRHGVRLLVRTLSRPDPLLVLPRKRMVCGAGKSFVTLFLQFAKEDSNKTLKFLSEYWGAILRLTTSHALRTVDAFEAEYGDAGPFGPPTCYTDELKKMLLSVAFPVGDEGTDFFSYELQDMVFKWLPSEYDWTYKTVAPRLSLRDRFPEFVQPFPAGNGRALNDRRWFLENITADELIAGLSFLYTHQMIRSMADFEELRKVSGQGFQACLLIYALEELVKATRRVCSKPFGSVEAVVGVVAGAIRKEVRRV